MYISEEKMFPDFSLSPPALAIHLDELIRKGTVRDYADLARLGGVTRARITQIMNLLNLALDIQEQLLFFPGMASGRDSVSEREIRRSSTIADWKNQQYAFKQHKAYLLKIRRITVCPV